MKFCITLGQRHVYRQENGEIVDHNNWIEIEAENEISARKLAHEKFRDMWAFIYPAEKFDSSYYPKGPVNFDEIL